MNKAQNKSHVKTQQLIGISVEKEILNFKIIFETHYIFRFLFGNFCTEDMSLFCIRD